MGMGRRMKLMLLVAALPSALSLVLPIPASARPATRSCSPATHSPTDVAIQSRSQRSSSTRLEAAAAIRGGGAAADESSKPLPRELLPITMGVFAQMLGEGISLSSLPIYLTSLGASPVMVGLAISCFSVAQMTFAPIAVGLSSKIGRSIVLRICLAGAAASSCLIAFSGSVYGVIAGRTLAGVFAACVPVAQSGVTDILPRNQTALGLSRVSAAAQLGVVVGPLASATCQEGFAAIGVPAARCLPAVFILNACNAMFVLALMTVIQRRDKMPSESEAPMESQAKQAAQKQKSTVVEKGKVTSTPTATVRYSQPMLRTITIVVGWTAILSNSIYGLFAPRVMGYGQSQLSATYSAAAVLMVATQIVFPRIVAKIGEHKACTAGILAVATGIGGQSLVRIQPLHSLLYMINRAGAAVADTSTAALVASSSTGREDRSRNLALLTSTRAAARIFTPLLSSKMFELSCRRSSIGGVHLPRGALPFVTAACFCLAAAPLPIVLRRAEGRAERKRVIAELIPVS
eukprot:CAMPEP_0201870192 /NCGR_PEP_ID=MMETSP0902-20130614/3389_1 /ASSEMBLY_ACC=CAM_ASM_000551 /TAXON_ID=420261 /ORGANISM="Thalassiosira antarctica, Strain CCMP982" /LENGTH=518 /DNA_ID=CAMNT_0048395769 /DNA_START=1 /DNA_END=1557 /DNA_ORIENTATION=+